MKSAGDLPSIMKTSAVLFVIAIAATSCASTSHEMKSWIGKPEAELLTSWGPPYASQQLDDGRVVHTWRTIWGKRDNIRTCRQTFTISPDKAVESSSYRGCPRMQSVSFWE
jgi:hypothetical protein